MNRCMNDVFSYCKDKPQPITKEVTVKYRDFGGLLRTQNQLLTHCKLNAPTCGFHLTHTQLHAHITS